MSNNNVNLREVYSSLTLQYRYDVHLTLSLLFHRTNVTLLFSHLSSINLWLHYRNIFTVNKRSMQYTYTSRQSRLHPQQWPLKFGTLLKMGWCLLTATTFVRMLQVNTFVFNKKEVNYILKSFRYFRQRKEKRSRYTHV